jgi:hypothetical protein
MDEVRFFSLSLWERVRVRAEGSSEGRWFFFFCFA